MESYVQCDDVLKTLSADLIEKKTILRNFIQTFLKDITFDTKMIENEYCQIHTTILSKTTLHVKINLKFGYRELLQTVLSDESQALYDAGYKETQYYGSHMSFSLKIPPSS
jgi:hypothetical protein